MFVSHASLEHLVQKYGYLAILGGTMLEGETIVLIAGFFAYQKMLSLPWIIVFAFLGSTMSDQGIFFLTRKKGKRILQKKPKMAQKIEKFANKVQRYPLGLFAFALLFRFFYGLRNIAPVFLGLSSLPSACFVVLNCSGALLWASAFSYAGYGIAAGAAYVNASISFAQHLLVTLLVAGLLGVVLYRYLYWRHHNNKPE